MRTPNLVTLLFLSLFVLLGCGSDNEENTVEGIWEGRLKYPGFESRIVFVVTELPDGILGARMLKPDESDDEVPVSKILSSDSHVRLQVDPVSGCFDGVLDSQGKSIKGQWNQGRWSQPLVLQKVPEIVRPRRPQTPVPPYPYDQQEITSVNPQGEARLVGTLTLPQVGGPFPAVVLIPGSGAHDRDYTILRHRPFLVLADYLTRHGVAVLRFDERGFGESTGDRSQATSADYALDALAGVGALTRLGQIDPNRIGLIGHSEGGTIAAIAAARDPGVAFIVMMGAPGLPGKEYNLQFEESTARSMGQSEETIAARRSFQERILAVVLEEKDPAIAEARLRRLYQELSPSMPEANLQAAIKRLLSPWFRFNLTHDPGATLKTVACPVLAIIGGKDMQVPPDGNLDAIRQALQAGGNKNHRIEELPGLNHFLQIAPTGSPFEYGKIEETISPTALELVCTWIIEQTKG